MSTNKRILLRCSFIAPLSRSSHSWKRIEVIQAFLLARYMTGRDALSMPRKHLGFSALPMTSGFSLWPAAEYDSMNAPLSVSLSVHLCLCGTVHILLSMSFKCSIKRFTVGSLMCMWDGVHILVNMIDDGSVGHYVCNVRNHLTPYWCRWSRYLYVVASDPSVSFEFLTSAICSSRTPGLRVIISTLLQRCATVSIFIA